MGKKIDLTGQRNDNSVLFSLGEFAAASQAGGASRPRGPTREGSGLLDIRAMREVMDTRPAPQQPAGPRRGAKAAPTMPSFGGGGLNALSAAPLVVEPPRPGPSATTRSQPSRGPLYLLVALLSFSVLGLGALMLLDQPREILVARTVDAAAPALDEVEPEDAEAKAPAPEPEPEPEPEELEAATTEPDDEPDDEPKPRTRDRKRTKTPKAPETAKTPKAPAPAEPKSEDISVDCLLDHSKCTNQPSTPKVAEPKPPSAAPPSVDLPAKLGKRELLTSVRSVKPAAKRCGTGATVAVKFSIAGSTGKVLSARPLAEHASTAVGECVAKAAEGASFPKFAAKQQGFTFKFRL